MLDVGENILARWQTSIENVACSPLEFYSRVKRSLAECELSDLRFSFVTRSEGGWLSAKRIYLRIRHGKLYFDVSAFIAGNSLVIGWWLHLDLPGVIDLLAEIPGLNFFLNRIVNAATYYRVELIEYFQRTVHSSILRIADELREESGAALLLDEVPLPIWKEIW